MLTLLALDLSPLVQPAITLLGLALTALCGIVGHAILSRTKSAKDRDILERAGEFMYHEVAALAQSEVPTLTRVLSTGKLTASDARALRDKAIGFVKLNLGPDGLKALGAATGSRSVDDFLLSLLESHVGGLGKTLTLSAGEVTTPVVTVTAEAPKPAPEPAAKAGFAALPALIGAAVIVAVLAVVGATSGCSAAQQRHTATASIVTAGGIISGLYTASQTSYHIATGALRARGLTGAAYDTAVAPLNAAYRARARALGSLDSCTYSGATIIDNAADPNVGLASSASATQTIDCINAALPELESGDVLPAIPIPAQLTTFVHLLDSLANGSGLTTATTDAGAQ